MTRLLITGNSHAGALRDAWNAMTERPEGLEVDFLNIAGRFFRHLVAAPDGRFGLLDETLVPAEDLPKLRMINEVLVRDLGDYTHVLIAGCFIGFEEQASLLSSCRIDLVKETPHDLPRLSQATYQAFSEAIALKTLPLSRIETLSRWCKVGFSVTPHTNERILKDPDAQPASGIFLQDDNGVQAAFALTNRVLDRTITARGGKFFPVPDQSLAASGLTRESYSFITPRVQFDYKHMNADYGALCLAPILEWVRA